MRSSSLALICLLAAAPASAQVVRLSVSTAGTQANGPSSQPALSGDGRFVAFASEASNLVPGDTNGYWDVFLRDRDTDADGVFDEPAAVSTTRLSVRPGGGEADGTSLDPAITADGRYVAFTSTASGLVPGVGGGIFQVYRLDRTTGAIVLISSTNDGIPGNGDSRAPSLSDDGEWVAFQSVATNLWSLQRLTTSTIFMRFVPHSILLIISPTDTPRPTHYVEPTVSADGWRVAYRAILAPPSAPLSWPELFDRVGSFSRRVGAGEDWMSVRLSASGKHLVGRTSTDVRRQPVDLGPVAALTAVTSGYAPLAASPSARYHYVADGLIEDFALGTFTQAGPPAIAAAFDRHDRWVAIASDSGTLVAGDANGAADIFAIDLPALLDADHDTMDDLWESVFQVADPAADPDGDGATNAQEFAAGTHPSATFRRYLAEGATGSFFTTDIALANPSLPASVLVTFQTGAGTRVSRAVDLRPGYSAVVHTGGVPGLESADFSTTVESNQPIGVTRVMSWDTLPTYVSYRGYGAHAETAVPSPSPTWLLAEGSTVVGFDLFYLLQNPQATITHTTVRFLLPSGATIDRTYDLAPGSRTTIYVNQVPGLEETDVSGDIRADAPIVVERAMYRSLPGQPPFGLGHGAMGVTAPATRWFLAEGATGSFFDLYVLIANPGDSDAIVDAQYARPDGSVVSRQYAVRAHSRFSVFVDAIPGLESTPVATTMTSANGVPIVVERAMYWPGTFFDYYEGHSSAGSTATSRRWVVAGGELGGTQNAQTFVLIANTSAIAGTALVTVLPNFDITAPPPPPVGPTQVVLPPNSRTTIPISAATATFGVLVESTGATPVDLVVESAIYRSPGEVTWAAGANALATPLP